MTGIRATLKWWPLWLILAALAITVGVRVVTDGGSRADGSPPRLLRVPPAWRGEIAVAVPTDVPSPTLLAVATSKHRTPTVIYRAPAYQAIRDIAWSPDGVRLAVVVGDPGGPAHVLVMGASGDDVHTVTHGDDVTTSSVAWSPDGRRLAYDFGLSLEPNRGTPIVVSRDDGSHRRLVSPKGAFAIAPAWSPDGRRIAYIAMQSPQPVGVAAGRLKVAPVNRSGPPLWIAHDYDGHDPVWTPDGRQIVFATTWLGGQGLATVRPRRSSTVFAIFDCTEKLRCTAIGRPTFGPGVGGLAFMTSAGDPPRTRVSITYGTEADSVPILRFPGHTCCLAWWTPQPGQSAG